MRRPLGIGVLVLVALVLVLELAAIPVATRIIGSVVSRCVAYDHLEVTSVARPVVPRLLVGRARDVELHATGVVAGDLRLADARLTMQQAYLPWAVGAPDVARADLDLRVDEADLERILRSVVPLGVPVEVELRPDVATLGSSVVPVTLDVEVEVGGDGTVRLRPVRGGELLERLGIGHSFPPGETARVTDLSIEEGALHGALALDVVPGVGTGGGCQEPLGLGAGRAGLAGGA
ncbi:LmeA family phospholipid-binding protein [Nitriliruptor alkaliphilus]|uniref:LmeA family phospholipid-binding protein n=1 Tax=Nitriliruptor alkaliphilus TaxID=427918 RepID=UPI000696F945|nr:LmeA family phospholipid-binding protein [Nitriliruptor alkaliphilus]